MTVLSCHRMPPCRDSLRKIAAIPDQSPFQSITTRVSDDRVQAESPFRRGGVEAVLKHPSTCSSRVQRPGSRYRHSEQHTPRGPGDKNKNRSHPLTLYSRIFWRQPSLNQQLTDHPCKIFKTRGFNLITFQYFAKSRLQNIENRDFIFLLFS